jgi:hypothetical protein
MTNEEQRLPMKINGKIVGKGKTAKRSPELSTRSEKGMKDSQERDGEARTCDILILDTK